MYKFRFLNEEGLYIVAQLGAGSLLGAPTLGLVRLMDFNNS